MARIKGLFSVSSNYEPTIAAPLDAREVVQYKSDLFARKTWLKNNAMFLYNGLRVSVTEDTEQNNGVYVLLNKERYMEESAWQKLATSSEIEELRAEIEEGSSFDPTDIYTAINEVDTKVKNLQDDVEKIPVVQSGDEVALGMGDQLTLVKASVEKLYIPEGTVLVLDGGEDIE